LTSAGRDFLPVDFLVLFHPMNRVNLKIYRIYFAEKPHCHLIFRTKGLSQKSVIPRLARNLRKTESDYQRIAGQARNDGLLILTFDTAPLLFK
jgi:hypothetical protein